MVSVLDFAGTAEQKEEESLSYTEKASLLPLSPTCTLFSEIGLGQDI